MSGPQTPGPAGDPPAAGSGPRVPVSPGNGDGGTGDPANIALRIEDLLIRSRLCGIEAAHLVGKQAELVRQIAADRDDYAARLKATDRSWADIARQRDEALAAIERVRAVHVEHGPDGNGLHCCVGCSRLWPCPTVRVLDASGGAA